MDIKYLDMIACGQKWLGEILDTESSLSDKQKSSHQSYFTSAYEDYNILIYFFSQTKF